MSKTDRHSERTRVWDLPVRLLHWALAACVLTAWFSSGEIRALHVWCGYGAAAIVALRLLWGWRGSRYARFSQFVRGPRATLAYARQVISGHEPRHLGHNPLGGWMVVALLSCVALQAVVGWAMDTDLLWGLAWPVRIHVAIGWTIIALVALHVAGVLFTSWRQRENLVAAMVSGDKETRP
ncbi:cytochrome b/b6 domain-containing protein [Oxalobacteraceae bacterium A2-2]